MICSVFAAPVHRTQNTQNNKLPRAPVTGRGGLPVPLPGRLVFLGAPAGGVGFGVPLGCPEVTGRAPGHAHAAFFVYVV